MAVLVGIYLLDFASMEAAQDRPDAWVGVWSLFRSPSGDRRDWVALIDGRTQGVYDSRELACLAAQDAGASVARQLQADEGLEPMYWPPKTQRCMTYSSSYGHQ